MIERRFVLWGLGSAVGLLAHDKWQVARSESQNGMDVMITPNTNTIIKVRFPPHTLYGKIGVSSTSFPNKTNWQYYGHRMQTFDLRSLALK